MKKYFIIALIIFSIFVNTISINGTTVEDDLTYEESQRTIDELNEIRKQLGINEVANNDELEKSSLIHSKYMYYNDTYSSFEENGKTYYRGKDPLNRARYQGYNKPYVLELRSQDIYRFSDGINRFIQNPYSRTILLDPVYKDIGMANHNGLYTFTFGGNNREKNMEIIYPYNNQSSVPITWKNSYTINPYIQLGIENLGYGLPITYTYYSDTMKVDQFNIHNITLINENTGANVDYRLITPKIDRSLKNTLVILPLEKYDDNTVYNLKIDMDVEFTDYTSRKVDLSNKFSTGSSFSIKSENDTLLTRGKGVESIITSMNFATKKPSVVIFYDIDIGSTDASYIYTALKLNIIKGYTDFEFKPNLNITKEQAYTMIIRAYESKKGILVPYSEELQVNDYDEIGKWFLEEGTIQKADSLGILIRDDEYNMNPKDYITEKEFNQILEIVNNL